MSQNLNKAEVAFANLSDEIREKGSPWNLSTARIFLQALSAVNEDEGTSFQDLARSTKDAVKNKKLTDSMKDFYKQVFGDRFVFYQNITSGYPQIGSESFFGGPDYKVIKGKDNDQAFFDIVVPQSNEAHIAFLQITATRLLRAATYKKESKEICYDNTDAYYQLLEGENLEGNSANSKNRVTYWGANQSDEVHLFEQEYVLDETEVPMVVLSNQIAEAVLAAKVLTPEDTAVLKRTLAIAYRSTQIFDREFKGTIVLPLNDFVRLEMKRSKHGYVAKIRVHDNEEAVMKKRKIDEERQAFLNQLTDLLNLESANSIILRWLFEKNEVTDLSNGVSIPQLLTTFGKNAEGQRFTFRLEDGFTRKKLLSALANANFRHEKTVLEVDRENSTRKEILIITNVEKGFVVELTFTKDENKILQNVDCVFKLTQEKLDEISSELLKKQLRKQLKHDFFHLLNKSGSEHHSDVPEKVSDLRAFLLAKLHDLSQRKIDFLANMGAEKVETEVNRFLSELVPTEVAQVRLAQKIVDIDVDFKKHGSLDGSKKLLEEFPVHIEGLADLKVGVIKVIAAVVGSEKVGIKYVFENLGNEPLSE